MDDFDKTEYWTNMSDYDFETAKAMLKTKRYLYVGFMCHQAVEKIMKAVYVNNKVPETLPYIHNLTRLARAADVFEDMTIEQQDLLSRLEPLNVESRYPKEKDSVLTILTDEYCHTILEETEALIKWLKTQLQ